MRASVGTGVLLMAVGAIIAFAVQFPTEVEQYVQTFDPGLILIWAGILVLVMQVVMHRPRRARTPRRARDHLDYPTDEHDVHRPGYAGETRRLPTVRGDGRR
ncbi:MAG: hypothetical protein ACXV4A_13015 [Actinomycetes bacterium]